MSTIFASFIDAASAERAGGALLDQGALAHDISIVANQSDHSMQAVNANLEASNAERSAKSGISTTTAADAATGAMKGATIGAGIGIAALLVSVFVPGVGLILGGGALATALAGGAATMVAGTAAGGVVGYLRDQGVPDEMATRYSSDFSQGGAILGIGIPSGTLLAGEIESILMKYGAMNIATYNSANVLIDDPTAQPQKVPLNLDSPNLDPIETGKIVEVFEPVSVTQVRNVVEASTGETRVVATHVQPVEVDPVTGMAMSAVTIDPLTGVERPVVVDPLSGAASVPPVTPIPDISTGLAVDPLTGRPLTAEPMTPEEEAIAARRKDVDLR